MFRRTPWLVLPFALALGVACGGTSLTKGQACAAGQSIACVSANGCSGAQICKADGSGYEPCTCFAGEDGGSPSEGSGDAGHDAGGDTGAAAADSAVDSSGVADSGSSDADARSSDAALDDAGCLAWALGGTSIPAGTIATASSTYSTDVASLAIDGNLSTLWNATGTTASLTLQFPTSIAITGIRIAASSSPATSETYTITSSADPTLIGSGTETVNGTPGYTIEPSISVTPGMYPGLTINVDGNASWAVINEVSLLTTSCQ